LSAAPPRHSVLLADSRAVPALFVLLWSTGFVGARWGLPHAGPFSLLAVRMICATLLLGVMAAAARAVWPTTWRDWMAIVVSGLLTHGAYLGGVFAAIAAGAPTGMVALIVGLQPLLTAACGPLAGQAPSTGRQWFALLLGLVGLVLVIPFDGQGAIEARQQLTPALIALVGITAGSLIQKRWVPQKDFRVVASIQYAGAGLVFALFAAGEHWRIEWTAPLLASLAWLTLTLSVGAVWLLYRLIRERPMEQVTSLFYVTPAVTALFGLVLFDETLSILQWLGFPIVCAAVWLGTRRA
jgi:drug/metabolite transporter (DMT)-like permease